MEVLASKWLQLSPISICASAGALVDHPSNWTCYNLIGTFKNTSVVSRKAQESSFILPDGLDQAPPPPPLLSFLNTAKRSKTGQVGRVDTVPDLVHYWEGGHCTGLGSLLGGWTLYWTCFTTGRVDTVPDLLHYWEGGRCTGLGYYWEGGHCTGLGSLLGGWTLYWTCFTIGRVDTVLDLVHYWEGGHCTGLGSQMVYKHLYWLTIGRVAAKPND